MLTKIQLVSVPEPLLRAKTGTEADLIKLLMLLNFCGQHFVKKNLANKDTILWYNLNTKALKPMVIHQETLTIAINFITTYPVTNPMQIDANKKHKKQLLQIEMI